MAASDYVRGSKDDVWLKKNYPGIKAWATKMLAMDQGTGTDRISGQRQFRHLG